MEKRVALEDFETLLVDVLSVPDARNAFIKNAQHSYAAEQVSIVASTCRDLLGRGWDDATLMMVASYCDEFSWQMLNCDGSCSDHE